MHHDGEKQTGDSKPNQPVPSVDSLSYGQFVSFLLRNEAVLVKQSGLGWTLNDQSVWDVLKKLEDEDVTVESALTHRRSSMRLKEFLTRTVENGEVGLYAKDLHFDLLCKKYGMTVPVSANVPTIFRDDWLNWYYQVCRSEDRDDYSFLYVGGEGSLTGVHHDVVCSFSWSANCQGTKRWILIPPDSVSALFDCTDSSLVDDLRKGQYSEERFPQLRDCTRLEVIQTPGTVLFVPSGWYHMVINEVTGQGSKPEDKLTISINRNWINSFNIYQVWAFLRKELLAVRTEISDFRAARLVDSETPTIMRSIKSPGIDDLDLHRGNFIGLGGVGVATMSESEWFSHCETLLRANAALGLFDFVELIASRSIMMHTCAARRCCPRPENIATLAEVAEVNSLLCPRYCTNLVSKEDHDLCELLVSTTSDCLLLERADLELERSNLFPRDQHLGDCIHQQLTTTGNIWEFTCKELQMVIASMKLCPEAIEHLGANARGLDLLSQLLESLVTVA